MIDTVAFWIGERLLTGTVQGAVLIALVWLACRFLPRMPPAAQAMLWWLAALKLVLLFAPIPTLRVPLLPAGVEAQKPVAELADTAIPDRPAWTAADSHGEPAGSFSSADWLRAIVSLWVLGVLIHVARLIRGHRALRGIVRRSVVVTDATPDDLARRIGLTRVPQVRVSDEIEIPQAVGVRTPIVLLPSARVGTFTDEERTMTVCHELMHIRRRDLVLGWVPACAERLFFFHPLAHLAAREYLTAREAACDAAVVRALGVAPVDYGRLLMRLGVADATPAFSAGGSSISASALKRRLHMLQHSGSSEVSHRWRLATGAAVLAVLPIRLVAQTPVNPVPLPPSPLSGGQVPAAVLLQPSVSLKGLTGSLEGNLHVTPDGQVEGTVEGTLALQPQDAASADDPGARLDAAQSELADARKMNATRQALMKLLQEVERQKQQRPEWDNYIRDVQEALRRMAQETGGIAIVNQTDFDKAISRGHVIELQRLIETLKAVEADVAQANAGVSRGKESTATFLENELRQTMLRQQEALKQQIDQLKQLQENLAAQQKLLAEQIQRLQQSLEKR